MLTQDFGKVFNGVYFITGVAINDFNNNKFYDINEGRGNIRVDVNVGAVHTGPDFTEATGGYGVAYGGGNAVVTFSGGGLPQPVNAVVFGGLHNVKVDLLGTSTISSSASTVLATGALHLNLLGIGALNGTGNGGNNILTGNRGANTLDGKAGNDTLMGGVSPDKLIGDTGIDTASYSDSFAPVSVNLALATAQSGGTAQGDTLSGIENVLGSRFGDTLTGSTGANTLTGSSGKDVLRGNAGADSFDFNTLLDSVKGANRDQVLDFVRTQGGKIDLSTIDADIHGTPGNQAFTFIGGQPFHGIDGELRFANKVLFGDVNGDRVADFEVFVNVANLFAGPSVPNDDIILQRSGVPKTSIEGRPIRVIGLCRPLLWARSTSPDEGDALGHRPDHHGRSRAHRGHQGTRQNG